MKLPVIERTGRGGSEPASRCPVVRGCRPSSGNGPTRRASCSGEAWLSYAHRRRAAKAHTRQVELCWFDGSKTKRPSRGARGRGVGVWRRLSLGEASRANAHSRADARVRARGRRLFGRLSGDWTEVEGAGCHAECSIRVCENGASLPGAHCTTINGGSQRGVSMYDGRAMASNSDNAPAKPSRSVTPEFKLQGFQKSARGARRGLDSCNA